MDIREILRKPWDDAEAQSHLLVKVQVILMKASRPMTTGALIKALLPGRTDEEYRHAVTALCDLRKLDGAKPLWRYTGKQNRYGKPAIQWLCQ